MNKFVQVFAFIQFVDAPVHLLSYAWNEQDDIRKEASRLQDLVKQRVGLLRNWMFYDLNDGNCAVMFFEDMPNIERYYVMTNTGMLVEPNAVLKNM